MLATCLVAHPAATPELLTAAARLAWPDEDTIQEVLAHPNTPEPVITELVDRLGVDAIRWQPLEFNAVISRTHLTAAVANWLRADTRRRDCVALARQATRSQLDRLITHAEQNPNMRHTLVPAVLDADDASPEQHERLARILAHDPTPQPAARTWAVSLLDRLAPAHAMRVADELTVSSQDLAEDLSSARTRATIRLIAVDAAIRAAFTSQSRDPWTVLFGQHPDRDGSIATTLLGRNSPESALAAIADCRTVPLPLRAAAYIEARRRGGDSAVARAEGAIAYEVLPHVDLAYVSGIIQVSTSLTILFAAAQRTDLPPNLLASMFAKHSGVANLAGLIAVHPNSTDELRDRAWEQLRTFARSPGWPYETALLAELKSVRDAVRNGVPLTQAGLLLPATSLTQGPPWVQNLATSTLDTQLPLVRTADDAACLLGLAEEFPGTIGELFTTAISIAEP